MEIWRFLLYCVLPYAAAGVCLGGLGWRVYTWAATPAPLKVPLTPGPAGRLGALGRVGWEALASPSLWRGERALWVGGGLFHICLGLVLLRHLRFFLTPVPAWVTWLGWPETLAGYLLPLALLYLLMRRLGSERMLFISRPADYLALVLLLALAGSGLWLRLGARVPLEDVKGLMLGLVSLHPAALPYAGALGLHLLLALTLLAVLPFSKLVHALALPFNPVLGQRDNALARLWKNPWARDYEQDGLGSADLAAGERPFFSVERYRGYLKFRWSGAGVHRVMGAGERAATLPGQGDGHDL